MPEDTPWLDNNLPQDAIITNIEVPDNAFWKHSAYVKVRDRTSYAFALVSVAAALDLDGKTIKMHAWLQEAWHINPGVGLTWKNF